MLLGVDIHRDILVLWKEELEKMWEELGRVGQGREKGECCDLM